MKKIMKKDKPQKGTHQKESLPAWFNKELDKKDPTQEEKDELNKILEELV